MSKPKKHTNELDIQLEIMGYKRKVRNQRRLAEKHQTEMKRWFDLANNTELEGHIQEHYRNEGFKEKRLMQRNLTMARRIEEDALPRLGRALSAFKTKTFAFMGDDRSVVAS